LVQSAAERYVQIPERTNVDLMATTANRKPRHVQRHMQPSLEGGAGSGRLLVRVAASVARAPEDRADPGRSNSAETVRDRLSGATAGNRRQPSLGTERSAGLAKCAGAFDVIALPVVAYRGGLSALTGAANR
jgi:hypothetical protein